MKLYAYSIRDVKAATWGTPFFMKNDATAKRAFYNLVNDPQSTVHRNPEDYFLHRIGSWDDEPCTLSNDEDNLVATATELVDHGKPVTNVEVLK